MSEPKLQIVVPMAGTGKSFTERGPSSFPKSLVEIDGEPMIEVVVRNLTPDQPHRFIFVVRQDEVQRFALRDVLHLIAPGCAVQVASGQTAGALCSVMLAIDSLDPDGELLIANADQVIDTSITGFIDQARAGDWDGFIMTFPTTHPKWSFVKKEGDQVVAVAEKRPISNEATVGLYYFRTARLFLELAERMLSKNVGNQAEFYVCPVYNEMVLKGLRIGTTGIDRHAMHSLGTPADVEQFRASRRPPAPSLPDTV